MIKEKAIKAPTSIWSSNYVRHHVTKTFTLLHYNFWHFTSI